VLLDMNEAIMYWNRLVLWLGLRHVTEMFR